MSAREGIVCTLRPDGTTLWLPEIMAGFLGLQRGQRMTEAQFASDDIQRLLAGRLSGKKKGNSEG